MPTLIFLAIIAILLWGIRCELKDISDAMFEQRYNEDNSLYADFLGKAEEDDTEV